MTIPLGPLPVSSATATRVAKPTDAQSAASFQAAMMAQLLKPALPRLVSAFGGARGPGGEMMEQFAGQVLSDALAAKMAQRDPFQLTDVVLDAIELRSRQSPSKGTLK